MNSDNQQMAGVPISTRVARLFFEGHKNTAEIATIIGWNEAAIDRLVSKILDGAHCLRRQVAEAPGGFQLSARVRLRADALVLWQKHFQREGVVVGYPRLYPDCLMVRWNGRRTPNVEAVSRLERIVDPMTTAEQSDNAKRGYELAIQTLREWMGAAQKPE